VLRNKPRKSFKPEEIPIVCLMGTTATGKTDAAAELFEVVDSEIISVDSSLVYRGMNIGSAKPDRQFLERYPHHCVDIREPNDTYSVADFYSDAFALIQSITEKGKLPILVGGTNFYFSALEFGLTNLPRANEELREKISSEAKIYGWQAMHDRLKVMDSKRAVQIDPNDAQRIQRALEIVIESGTSVDQQNDDRKPALANPMIKIALAFSDRSYLHERIETRFDLMLEQGLQSEVEGLLQSGVDPDCSAMKMIGYRQMLEFLHNNITYDEMRSKGIAATRQLAKRQLTWLRQQSNVVWWVDFGLKQKKFDKLIEYVNQIVI